MSARIGLGSLIRDRGGSVAIEFAILGPTVIAMMLGVVQFGIGMQAYNSMRSVAAETARYATVQYQKSNSISNTALETQARAIATGNRYRLQTGDFTVTVTTPTTQRVTGAGERTISMTYSVKSILQIQAFPAIPLTYSRPIFVLGS